MRALFAIFATLLIATPAVAQQMNHDPDSQVANGGQFPAGWQARVDRDRPATQVSFTATNDGFHAVMGTAAALYNPAWTKSGDYSYSARFTQNAVTPHREAYGIFIGGSNLGEANEAYSYFEIGDTGEYYIATRKGVDVTKVVDWTANPAIQKPDASGVTTNVLGAQVQGDNVIFTVNGTEVARRPTSDVLSDGLVGFRINHHLDVNIDQVQR